MRGYLPPSYRERPSCVQEGEPSVDGHTGRVRVPGVDYESCLGRVVVVVVVA
jgi:hypothetical protein